MDYPKLIKEYRNKKIITQVELAIILGVSFVSVNRWENGHFNPTIKTKRKIHQLLVEAKIIE